MKRKALAPVISTLILSAAVIVVGGSIWSYALGASTLVAENYVNDTLELVNEVTERFIVEHVCFNSTTDEGFIWIYNYGEQKIIIDAYLNVTNSGSYVNATSLIGWEIEIGESREIPITNMVADSGNKVSIRIYSRRANSAYKTYYVP
jgi:hypothetical protein